MVLLAGSWGRILVHRGPAIVSINTACTTPSLRSSMCLHHTCDSLRHRLSFPPPGVGFAHKYEARLSAGFSGGPRWLDLCTSSEGPVTTLPGITSTAYGESRYTEEERCSTIRRGNFPTCREGDTPVRRGTDPRVDFYYCDIRRGFFWTNGGKSTALVFYSILEFLNAGRGR